MKIYKYIQRLQLLVLTMAGMLIATSILTSCEEDDTIEAVTLHSFGPSGVEHGDTIKFIGLNLDKVSAIVLSPDLEIASSQFVAQTATEIKLKVPIEATAGKVKLKSTDGEIESLTLLSFNVPVEITSITGEVKPGNNVTITGTLINWIESVTFEDGIVVEEFESQSLTELVVQVPMEAQTGHMIFSSGGTEPLTFASENPLVVSLPEVTALSPSTIRHEGSLTLTGVHLDLVTSLTFSGDLVVDKENFSNHSATEIVVDVPALTLSGPLTLHQLSPVDVVTTQSIGIILPVGTDIGPSPAIPGSSEVTIDGTDLDLVAELGLPGIDPIAAANFTTHTATQIVFSLPEGAESGGVTYTTIHGYSNNLGVTLIVPGEGPPPLAITMYDDEVFYNGGDWSWGTVLSDQASTEQFYSGSVSWKFTTDSDGGVSSGGMNPVDASGQGTFVFSLYGGEGTDGAQVAAILGDDTGDVWGNYNSVTLVEGEWTEYRLPLTQYPDVNLSSVQRWIFKVEGITGTTIYVDRVGFDPAGPPPLKITMFDEQVEYNGGDWSWGTVLSDQASTEEAYSGDVSWKFTTDSDGGVSCGGMDPVDASTSSVLSFALFGGPGTDGAQVAVILGDENGDQWGNYNAVTLNEGEWTEYNLDLSLYPDVNLSSVQRWIFKVEEITGTTIYVDRVGFD